MACSHFGTNHTTISFERNKYGKPYIKNYPDFHFNISHSGKWVVCAVSSQTVGIDIECMNELDQSFANAIFTDHEKHEYLKKGDNPGRLKYIYEIWTLKESYFKYLGKGLSISITNIEFTFKQSQYEINNLDANLYFNVFLSNT